MAWAPYGRYGCDPPPVLLRAMNRKMLQQDPDVDAILTPGDWVPHYLQDNSIS
jgi:hypothetical protein